MNKVTSSQLLPFRLKSQHLLERQPGSALLDVAGACGVQNTPPGTAALALRARIVGLTAKAVDHALYEDKVLLQAWSRRTVPCLFPTADASTFTVGLLPEAEEEIRAMIYGVETALEKVGITAQRVVTLAAEGAHQILDGRRLTKDELGLELARWAPPFLDEAQRSAWQSPSMYAPGQSLGESMMRFALPLVALRGSCCHAERRGNQAYLARPDQWLAKPLPEMSAQEARARLARRYLHCYGPSTPQHFAEWAGISPAQAAQSWSLIESELLEVQVEDRRSWLLAGDLNDLQSALDVQGVRFLPPHDPFLELRDRLTLVPDKSWQARVWRTVGNPGVLLVDGRFAGIWRPQKKGRSLQVQIEPFLVIPNSRMVEIEAEAEGMAAFRGCDRIDIQFNLVLKSILLYN